MESQYVFLLSWIVFLPTVGALILAFFPKDKPDAIKGFSLACTVLVLLLTAFMAWPGAVDSPKFQLGVAQMQGAFSLDWIPSFGIYYLMGFDGISFRSRWRNAG